MEKHPSRAHNVSILKTFFQQAMKPKANKGCPDAEKLARKQLMEKKLKKLNEYESALNFFNSLQATKRRRIISKQESFPTMVDDGTSLCSFDVSYHYPEQNTVRSRRYARKGGAQVAPRRVQHITLPHTQDLDIHNCCLSILKQLLDKTNPTPALPEELQKVLNTCADERDSFVRNYMKISLPEGKSIINSILSGGLPPATMHREPAILKLQSLSIYCRWLACNLLPQDFDRFSEDTERKRPLASTLHVLWTAVEDSILDAWLSAICPMSPKHVSLHFDGVRIDRELVNNTPDLVAMCQRAILEKTGFDVSIAKKETKTIMQLIESVAETKVALRAVPAHLLEDGNCIPCALWHLNSKLRENITKIFGDPSAPDNQQALKSRCRSYRSCMAALKQDFTGCVGLPDAEIASFLLHFENDGKPHSVTVQYNASKEYVSVLNGSMHYRLQTSQFMSAFFNGIDTSTAVCFWQTHHPSSKQGCENGLLDLEAGMEGSVSESDVSDDVQKEQCTQQSFILDENEELAFPDVILKSLKEEVSQYTDRLCSKTDVRRQNGRYSCELCPFRSFKELRGLKVHVQKHHHQKNQFVCSGTKQIKAIAALHDHHAGLQERCKQYLQTTARLMSSTIVPALPRTKNYIDKDIRLLYTSSGPMYVSHRSLKEGTFARRVRNVYYDKSFAEAFLQEILMQLIQASVAHGVNVLGLCWCAERCHHVVASSFFS